MRKYVEIPLEVVERLVEGKCVEGSLRRDEWTGKVTFRAYQRQPRDRHERVVCQLENGWLKESPLRYKFYNSVQERPWPPHGECGDASRAEHSDGTA